MKAAVVTGAGERPVHMEFEPPCAMPGHSLIDVTASALSRIAQARASGTHYSSDGGYPLVVGVDGVGRRDDGQRVYFFGAPAPFGAMSERTIAADARCVPLPDALDDVTAAAIAIPGMSSWAALTERARLVAGETVLVNGATGTSGRLAVRIAKHLGAAKVIATGRNAAALDALLNAGADAVVSLQQDDAQLARALEPHSARAWTSCSTICGGPARGRCWLPRRRRRPMGAGCDSCRSARSVARTCCCRARFCAQPQSN